LTTIVRWLIALALVLGLLVTVLELSTGGRSSRASMRRPASVADVVTGRSADPSVPEAPEGDAAPASAAPAITY
jgi:hypothetical protein